MSNAGAIKRIFRDYGLAPKKWMGQNLLVEPLYLRRIVQASQIGSGDAVVEIGAGLGVLTEAMVNVGAIVWAIEIDSGFFSVLQTRFQGSESVHLIHANALKFDFATLAAEIGKLRVVANLPYNISSRLIFMFCENKELFSSIHVLLQKEVAERFVAEAGTKDYGVLTVLLGASAVVDILFHIPATAFFPAPQVTSTLVRILFPTPPPVKVADARMLTNLVKASFSGRRKTLRNCLKRAGIPGVEPDIVLAAAMGSAIDLDRRAETLSALEFARFADAISALSR